jgi:uncharacterized protein with HEPN domain
MKAEDRNYLLFLEDILLSMQRIQEYISDLDYNEFIKDYKTVDAVIRNFEIIGEAVHKLPKEIKLKYPSLPWDEIYLFRNRISHEYFGIDYEIVWEIATIHLPENRKEIEAIIEKETPESKS